MHITTAIITEHDKHPHLLKRTTQIIRHTCQNRKKLQHQPYTMHTKLHIITYINHQNKTFLSIYVLKTNICIKNKVISIRSYMLLCCGHWCWVTAGTWGWPLDAPNRLVGGGRAGWSIESPGPPEELDTVTRYVLLLLSPPCTVWIAFILLYLLSVANVQRDGWSSLQKQMRSVMSALVISAHSLSCGVIAQIVFSCGCSRNVDSINGRWGLGM